MNWIFKLKSGIRRLSDSTDIVFSPCADGDFADTGMRLGKLIFGGFADLLQISWWFREKTYFCGEKLNV